MLLFIGHQIIQKFFGLRELFFVASHCCCLYISSIFDESFYSDKGDFFTPSLFMLVYNFVIHLMLSYLINTYIGQKN